MFIYIYTYGNKSSCLSIQNQQPNKTKIKKLLYMIMYMHMYIFVCIYTFILHICVRIDAQLVCNFEQNRVNSNYTNRCCYTTTCSNNNKSQVIKI